MSSNKPWLWWFAVVVLALFLFDVLAHGGIAP
jgi:hypothetical protein